MRLHLVDEKKALFGLIEILGDNLLWDHITLATTMCDCLSRWLHPSAFWLSQPHILILRQLMNLTEGDPWTMLSQLFVAIRLSNSRVKKVFYVTSAMLISSATITMHLPYDIDSPAHP